MKNYIAEMRRERGLSLEQLAERTGLSKGTISRVENGSRSPSAETMDRIAEALACEPQALLAPTPDFIAKSAKKSPSPARAPYLRLVQ